MAIPGHGRRAAALGTEECPPPQTAPWPWVIARTIRVNRSKLAHYSLTTPPLGGLISAHAFAQGSMQPGRRQKVLQRAFGGRRLLHGGPTSPGPLVRQRGGGLGI